MIEVRPVTGRDALNEAVVGHVRELDGITQDATAKPVSHGSYALADIRGDVRAQSCEARRDRSILDPRAEIISEAPEPSHRSIEVRHACGAAFIRDKVGERLLNSVDRITGSRRVRVALNIEIRGVHHSRHLRRLRRSTIRSRRNRRNTAIVVRYLLRGQPSIGRRAVDKALCHLRAELVIPAAACVNKAALYIGVGIGISLSVTET